MTSAIGYARLSKAGNGHGIDQQREALASYCERHSLDLLRIEEDDGASGGSMKHRPGLAQTLCALERGEADVLVAAKLDRLSRSLLDFAALVELAQKQGWSLVVVDQSFDLSTSSGRAMAGMLAVFAQFEREMIGERTKAGLATARAKGVRLGNPQLAAVDPETLALMRGLRNEGERSYQAVADELNALRISTVRGASKWTKTVVYRILTKEVER